MSDHTELPSGRGAIVCSHVASGEYPICYATRDEPMDPEDSGWQFLCNSGLEEDLADAQIWGIDEVLKLEQSLKEYVNSPIGTQLLRANSDAAWASKGPPRS
jgi:hypothetical protein